MDVIVIQYYCCNSTYKGLHEDHHIGVGCGPGLHFRHDSQKRVDRALRLCTLCDRSDIEDEYHFVLICPVYSQIRQKYIRPFYYLRPSLYKFIKLMQSNEINVLRNLGKYVYESFAIRKSLYHIFTLYIINGKGRCYCCLLPFFGTILADCQISISL